jgi:hypothetical protein
VTSMKPIWAMVMAAAVSMTAQSALAFQETTVGGPAQQSGPVAPNMDVTEPPADANKGLNLSIPDGNMGRDGGREVRIPGLGTVGVLPKLDFGLELLYGANDSKTNGLPEDRMETNDVQIRGTIKHRF